MPGAAPNTFGNVICAGAVNTATPGAWMVMSKVCCVTPTGSMSCTICGGTAAMPTWKLVTGLPLASSALPGAIVSDKSLTCDGLRLGEAVAVVVTVVGAVVLTFTSTDDCTLGRYVPSTPAFAAISAVVPIELIGVLTAPADRVRSNVIVGK